MKKYISFFIILAVVSLLTACFSPWTGDSSITINLGRSTGRYYLSSEEDIEGFEYTITLRGPGGTITKQVKESGPVTFQVVPGIWTVDVRAFGDNTCNNDELRLMDPPVSFQNRDRILRALAIDANVEVKAGVNKPVYPRMISAIEVYNAEELYFAKNIANYFGGEEIIVFSAETKEIVIEKTMDIFNIDTSDPIKIDLTIISDGDLVLKRSPEKVAGDLLFPGSFFGISDNTSLTLGMPGMAGTITLDGGWDKEAPEPHEITAPLISVNGIGFSENAATLVINEDVNLVKNNSGSGGGVYVNEGTFIMNGGAISGNKANAGGGVYVSHDTFNTSYSVGTFTMSGGVISGNQADEGGGVYIDRDTSGGYDEGGAFIMSGNAVISGNQVGEGGGGGVCIHRGIFNMSENTEISENNAYNGGGVFVEEGDATMKGNAVIKNNTAYGTRGGGVCIYGVDNPASFEMLGGSIESNKCLLGDESGATYGGGGVYSWGGTFHMSGGGITKNRIPAGSHGAGVFAIHGGDNEVDESRITGNFIDDAVAPNNEQFYLYNVLG